MQKKFLVSLVLGLFGATAFAAETCSNIDAINAESVIAMARAGQLGQCRIIWDSQTMIIQVNQQGSPSKTAWSIPWTARGETEAFESFPRYSDGIRAATVLKDFVKAGACQ